MVLILINAFFASTEIAVISLSENKLKRQAEDGDAKAKRLLPYVSKPADFLSTIQIGITLAGFMGSAFAANSFSGRLVAFLQNTLHVGLPAGTLESISVVIITIVLSYFSLVFGELVPKRIAMQYSEKVAGIAVYVIRVFSAVARPAVWLLSKSTNGLLRLFGIDPEGDEESYSEDEIRMMVDIGQERGEIEESEREMIENIFEFNNTTAEDIMVHRTDMVVIWSDYTHEHIIDTIEKSGRSRFPVCDEDVDDVIGILNSREYMINALSKAPADMRSLLRPAYFVPETVCTDVLFRNMQSKKTHMAIVVDEYGGTSGLLTMEDLLEEIVGNIYDEFDALEELEISPIKENLWRVSGGATLGAIGEVLGIDVLEDEEYDTLGGLVFSRLADIPDDGSHPEVDAMGLHIVVEKLVDRRIEWALISRNDQEGEREQE